MYPTLATVFGIPLTSYYILWTLALCIGVLWTQRRAVRNFGVDIDAVSSVITWSFVAMLVGARIGGYFDNWSFYATHPERIWMFWEGGLSSTPAFLGAGIAGILLCRKNDIPVWKLADAASIPAAATYVVGRIGCFLNGCCYGRPAGDAFCGIAYPPVCEPGKLFPGVPLYPVQIIESACLLVIWAVLVFAYPRRKKDGAVFALYLLLYPPVRFALEYLRGDKRQSWFAFDVAQVTSIALFLAGILLFAFLPKNKFSPPPKS